MLRPRRRATAVYYKLVYTEWCTLNGPFDGDEIGLVFTGGDVQLRPLKLYVCVIIFELFNSGYD